MTVTDPVCGMTIDSTQAAATSEHNGKKYYFCSVACRQRFEEHPAQYTTD